MIGIIITGHGKIASGLKSSIELIAGKQEKLEAVDFIEGDSIEDLHRKIKGAVDVLNSEEGIIFFTDIIGGSPFKTSVMISREIKNSEVIAGTNLPAVINILFDRSLLSVDEIKNKALEAGGNGIKSFSDQIRTKRNTGTQGI